MSFRNPTLQQKFWPRLSGQFRANKTAESFVSIALDVGIYLCAGTSILRTEDDMYIERIGARKKSAESIPPWESSSRRSATLPLNMPLTEKRPMKLLAGFWWAFSKTHRSEAKPWTGTFPPVNTCINLFQRSLPHPTVWSKVATLSTSFL